MPRTNWGELSTYASRRQPSWRMLDGAFTADKTLPIREFANKAGLLGWNVRKQDAQELMPDARFVRPTFLNVRTSPVDGKVDVLGPVGKVYENFQVEQMLDTAEGISNRLRAETMFTFGRGLLEPGNPGVMVGMQFAHPDDIVLDPKGGADRIRRYFMLYKAFDGTSPLTGKPCTTRVLCENTFAMAISELSPEFKVRHTATMEARVHAAAQLSSFAETYDMEFAKVANELYAQEITNAKFDEIVAALYPKPAEFPNKASQTKYTAQIDRVWDVYKGSTGSMENLGFNAWRAFNALTEENQWFRQIRGGNTDNALVAGAGFETKTVEFRQNALNAVRALV